MFSASIPHEQLAAWAAAHDLGYEEQSLLPPVSPVLREGLGVGSKLAGLITSETDRGFTAQGGFTRRQERESHNVCVGTLPGGVPGTLAHHAHLELRSSGGEGGQTWVQAVDTVVLVQLPTRSRALCSLKARPGTGGGLDVALGTIDLREGPSTVIPGVADLREDRAGDGWTISPAEDRATLDAIASPATLAAIGAAPPAWRIELQDGVLCVSARGIVEEPAHLEALCRIAAGVAAGVAATVARHGDLDPSAPGPAPADTPRARWLAGGAATRAWPTPPASVAEARAGYESVVGGHSAASGRTVSGIVLGFGSLLTLLWAGALYGGSLLFGAAPAVAALSALGGLLSGAIGTLRATRSAGRETRESLTADQAGPWAVEAFARGYAQTRGLVLEDADVFRHRFATSLPGRPLRVMYGQLGPGLPGRVVLWRDWVAGRHWLLAVVPDPGVGTGDAPAPYVTARAAGHLTVALEVAEADRSAARLDALVHAVRQVAGVRVEV